jgi:hypothetical protein
MIQLEIGKWMANARNRQARWIEEARKRREASNDEDIIYGWNGMHRTAARGKL